MADLTAGGGCASDQDCGCGDKAHLARCGVKLHEAVALGVYQNSHSAQHGGKNGSYNTHAVYVDADGFSKARVVAHSLHGLSGLASGEQPYQRAADCHEEQKAGRNGKLSDLECQKII